MSLLQVASYIVRLIETSWRWKDDGYQDSKVLSIVGQLNKRKIRKVYSFRSESRLSERKEMLGWTKRNGRKQGKNNLEWNFFSLLSSLSAALRFYWSLLELSSLSRIKVRKVNRRHCYADPLINDCHAEEVSRAKHLHKRFHADKWVN